MSNNPIEYSLQTLKNLSADTSVSPPIPREGIVGKADDGNYYGAKVNPDGSFAESLPTSGQNPSLTLAYDGDGNLSTITKVINGVSYQKTLGYTDGVLTDISVWVQL